MFFDSFLLVKHVSGGRKRSLQLFLQKTNNVQLDLGFLMQDGLLLYIHGFKTSPELAIRCAAQLKYDLDFEGDVLAYCWPSEGTYWGYFKDGTAVVETALNLGRVITTLLNGKV